MATATCPLASAVLIQDGVAEESDRHTACPLSHADCAPVGPRVRRIINITYSTSYTIYRAFTKQNFIRANIDTL